MNGNPITTDDRGRLRLPAGADSITISAATLDELGVQMANRVPHNDRRH